MNNNDSHRVCRAINNIKDPAAREAAITAFREEFPETYWFHHHHDNHLTSQLGVRVDRP